MVLNEVKVRTKYHTSSVIHMLTGHNKDVIIGHTGFGIAIDPKDIDSLNVHGYTTLNKLVVALPAIPVVHKTKLLAISTNVVISRWLSQTPNIGPEASHILGKVASNCVTIPHIVSVDMERCMVPVVTDSAGKVYMTTSQNKVLYVNDVIEAQATIMQVTLPLPSELADLGKRFVRAVLPDDIEDKEEYFIYLKDKFVNVFET